MLKSAQSILIIFLVMILISACTPEASKAILADPDTEVAVLSESGDTTEAPSPAQESEDLPATWQTVETPEPLIPQVTHTEPTPNLQSSPMVTDTQAAPTSYPYTPGQQEVIAVVIEKLAGYLAVSPEPIDLIAARPAVWRDSHMGCPSNGRKAAQVIIPGYAVLLEVDGITYTYHTDESGRNETLCQPAGRMGAPEKTRKPPETLILKAREDLAGR